VYLPPEVMVSASTNAAESRLPACGILPWRQSDPCRKFPDRKRRPSPIAATSAFAITGEVEVFLNPFEEKLDEDETEGTIYARIPASLRRKIEAAAEAEGLSANSWASTVDHDPLPSATPRLKTAGNAVHRWC
jgi:HicB family